MTVPPAVLLELWCGVSCLCLCVRGVRYQVLQHGTYCIRAVTVLILLLYDGAVMTYVLGAAPGCQC